jgi:hypothetical protein
MVMSIENGDELQLFAAQIIQDRGRIARIYNGSMVMIADEPDVIVLEGVNRNNIGSCSHDRRYSGIWGGWQSGGVRSVSISQADISADS